MLGKYRRGSRYIEGTLQQLITMTNECVKKIILYLSALALKVNMHVEAKSELMLVSQPQDGSKQATSDSLSYPPITC
jgi:hypothetical protein